MTKEEIEEQMHINYDEGYKQGCLETIQKACDLIDANDMEDYMYLEKDGNMYFDYDKFLTEFRKAMEEQQ